jgi:Chitin synthase export chaperone
LQLQTDDVLFLGRKEITSFFYIYMMLTVCSLVLDAGVIPPGSTPYPYFVAAQCGLTSALCICLLINGFVGFQLYEDGTTLSVWLLRFSSLAMFLITGAVALCTFRGWAGLSPTKTIGLFVVLYLFSGLCLLVYVIMQIILVINTLQDRWPLGDIVIGVAFFIVGQVLLYVFSKPICEGVAHYLDGTFFATMCNLLAVMMVYKVCVSLLTSRGQVPSLTTHQFWDTITREDLEFSVGTKQNTWEVKELLPEDERRATVYQDGTNSEYAPSIYAQQNRHSGYNGFGY